MHHRTTHHKVTRDAPPTLRHDPKPQEGRDETNPFCVPFGHVVKSRQGGALLPPRQERPQTSDALLHCCTRQVFHPCFCEETHYCMVDLREAAVAKHGSAKAKREIEQREQQRKSKRRREEGNEGGPEAAGVHLL